MCSSMKMLRRSLNSRLRGLDWKSIGLLLAWGTTCISIQRPARRRGRTQPQKVTLYISLRYLIDGLSILTAETRGVFETSRKCDFAAIPRMTVSSNLKPSSLTDKVALESPVFPELGGSEISMSPGRYGSELPGSMAYLSTSPHQRRDELM